MHIFYLSKFEIWRLERPFQMRYLGGTGIIFVPRFVKPKGNDPPDRNISHLFHPCPSGWRPCSEYEMSLCNYWSYTIILLLSASDVTLH